jgi:hypothetical protein
VGVGALDDLSLQTLRFFGDVLAAMRAEFRIGASFSQLYRCGQLSRAILIVPPANV